MTQWRISEETGMLEAFESSLKLSSMCFFILKQTVFSMLSCTTSAFNFFISVTVRYCLLAECLDVLLMSVNVITPLVA